MAPAASDHGRILDGRIALVTGATRNLGLAATTELARNGAGVVLVTRHSPETAESVASQCRAEHGVQAMVVQADVGSAAEVAAAVERAHTAFGHVDVAIECAALRPHSPILDITVDQWMSVMNTNLSSAFFFARALLPQMMERRWGRIVHVSGTDGWIGYPNRAHNVAAKAGLHGLTKALAVETAPYGVTVNTIVPGVFRTERDPQNYPGWDHEEMAKLVPVGRLGDPHRDFARACTYLAEERAEFVTGQALHLNGGQWMF